MEDPQPAGDEQPTESGGIISSQSFMSSRERGEEIRKGQQAVKSDAKGVRIEAPAAEASGDPTKHG